MDKPIYFSKVEYQMKVGYGKVSNVILLDIVNRELSYQVFSYQSQMPSVQGIVFEEWNGNKYSHDVSSPARVVRDAKNGFKPQLIKSDQYEKDVVFSYRILLK